VDHSIKPNSFTSQRALNDTASADNVSATERDRVGS